MIRGHLQPIFSSLVLHRTKNVVFFFILKFVTVQKQCTKFVFGSCFTSALNPHVCISWDPVAPCPFNSQICCVCNNLKFLLFSSQTYVIANNQQPLPILIHHPSVYKLSLRDLQLTSLSLRRHYSIQ